MILATAMITKEDQGFMFRTSHYFLHTIMAIPRSGKLEVYMRHHLQWDLPPAMT